MTVVSHLLTRFCVFLCLCDVFLQALEKAKEAGRKERALVRQREQSGNADHINLDLTYSVSTERLLCVSVWK